MRVQTIWRDRHGTRAGADADAIDRQLHGERIDGSSGAQRHHEGSFDGLPDGAFVLHEGEPWVVVGAHVRHWTPGGYAERMPRPEGKTASVITPPSLVAILQAGWEPVVPLLHPSAR